MSAGDEAKSGSSTKAAEAARFGAVPVEPVPGRTCGTCMMCCKVYAIPELNKGMGTWCVHAARGVGCKIYDSRPELCRQFHCGWRLDPTLGPEWKPDRSRFVVALDLAGYRAFTISVDPGMPHVWKSEPYYSRIKAWATKFLAQGEKVLVVDGRGAATVVLPDRDLPIGVIDPADEIVIYREGSTYGAVVQRAERHD